MKNIIRAFVLTLVATGAVASLHATNNAVSSTVVVSGQIPVPVCPPDDPNGCFGSSSTR